MPVVLERPRFEVPARSMSQRMDALATANEVRSARARIKRDVKAGRRSVLRLLAEPPASLETMGVFDLLMAKPKTGRVKAEKALRECVVSPRKTVGGLSERQRTALIGYLRLAEIGYQRPLASALRVDRRGR